jgi:hypothetical protein
LLGSASFHRYKSLLGQIVGDQDQVLDWPAICSERIQGAKQERSP